MKTRLGSISTVAASLFLASAATSFGASSFFWTNTVSGAWSGAANWTNDTGASMAPVTAGQTNYTLSFNQAGTVIANNDLGSGFLLNQLNFGGDTVTLAGNSLALTNNAAALPQVNQNSSAAVAVNNDLFLGADTTFGGSGTGTVTVAGAMSGAGSLTKTGAGTLTLGDALTYSGATVISGGVLKLQGTTLKTLISAQFESAGGSVMSGNEALAAAADPVFSSSGTTWNQLLLPAYPTKITNPTFSGLKDRGTGLATGVGFSITGGGIVSSINDAWAAGNNLTKNIMVFGNFNGMSTGFNWQFSGLTPGATFKLELYGSAATVSNCGAFQTVDTNGDGSLNESPVTVIGTTPVLFTGTVGSNGLILGHADFAGTEGDWCGFQLAIYTLGSNNLLPSATALSITAGATFDVSAITNYTLGASASLTANGTGTAVGTDAAVIQGNSSGTVDLGSRPVTLAFTPAAFSGDTTHPALVVPQGALTLNGAVTVNINGSTPLGAGTYWLISQASGSISGTPTLAATTGPGSNNGLVSGASAVLQRTGGQINLLVSMSMISPSVTLTRHEGTGDTTTYGDALSFDVTVTPITPNTPTGDVTLKDGGTILGTYTLAAPDSGACVIAPALNALKAGSHTNIVAVYAGDINFNSGDSAALSTQTVSNKVLTIPDAQAHNKFYDGTTNATLTGTISGTVSGDSVTLTLSGHFADAAAGLGKAVTSTSTLDAPSQANYTLAQPAGLTADILAAAVWTNPAGGSWAASGNWQSGLVGSGANLAAAFSTLTLGGAGTVALNGARIIGNLLFGDQGNAHGWTLGTGSNGPLTLAVSSGSPTVNVTNQTLEISAVLTGSQGLTKTGAGTLILSATNTYSGATAVSGGTLLVNGALASGSAVTVAGGGTLTGAGTINGAVTIGSGGTLQPGTAGGLGTLTVNNTLTLLAGSTNVMRLNKAGAVLTNARVTGMTGVTYGGTLQVSATGDALAAGDTFILFTTASGEYSGSFTTLNLPALAGGLVWDTYSLAFNGSIVVSVSDKPGNTGTGGVVTYTDSNGSNSVSYPPYKNGYVVHAFVATGANTLSLPTSVSSADVLVVAGGGGGGWVVGGGGGAGGLLYQTGHTISSGSNTVTVGAGGLGAVAHANPNFEPPTSGGISSFGTLTAVGGGYGAYSDWVAHFPAAAGGSGGGGFLTAWSGADRLVAGAGTSGQGNAGADGSEGIYSGGGGGAGAPGSARNGGNGLDYSFLCGTGYGVSGWFAGGGGSGATVSSGLAGAGGTGGGGAGAAVSGAGASGVAHTGGGGGGGDQLNSTCGNGGSGIVIVRYPYELPRGTLIMLF